MKSKQFNRYYLFSCLGVLIASYYPLSMGVRVITDMLVNGTVMKENYPKYIIPYTPISVAIIIGVLLMPLFIRFFKKFAFAGGVLSAIGVFFGLELLFEQKVVVSTAETVTKLEDWQMFMCYVPPEGWGETVTTYKTQTAVDILMGDYNPAFKLHFYIISVLLIITILNCLYGFGQMIKNGDKKRCKSLILQSICSVVFLGLCILACFTAFWRDGSIQVSPLSAALMTVFFILFGVTAGVFGGFNFRLGYKAFDLAATFSYQLGGHMLDTSYAGMLSASEYGYSMHPDVKKSWKQPGDVTEFPRLDANATHNSNVSQSYSTRWLTSSDYLNLRSVSLGYTVPKALLNKISLKSARLNLTCENVFMLKARQGMNPQANFTGLTYNEYMPARTFTLGLNVGF